MRTLKFGSMLASLLLASLMFAAAGFASGPLGITAIIERVEFEPDAEAPSRVRLFGAFSFYDSASGGPSGPWLAPARGVLTFSLPADGTAAQARREWSDLAAVAGSGEAVAFGAYGFIGQFADLSAERQDGSQAYVLGARSSSNLVVSQPDAMAASPEPYRPAATGVVRLGKGNYGTLIAALEAALAP